MQTIIPSVLRKVPISYERERLELEDGDFVDLDWYKNNRKKLIIVTHGLEGDSSRPYVTGLLKLFGKYGFDGLGWNCRSCSGEINRLPRFYHHGDANDLKAVVDYALSKDYQEIFLSGSSMGGSLSIRYLAEWSESMPSQVMGAFVTSVPLDIYDSVLQLCRPSRSFYMNRFLRKLKVKMELKEKMFPHNPLVSTVGFRDIKNFIDFDNRYTAPLHGYKSADDFYKQASTKPMLGSIKVPIMIVQAANDPFSGEKCLDIGDIINPNIKFKVTKQGGHVGFMEGGEYYTWAERRALMFYKEITGK